MARLALTHPNRKRLLAWLNAADDAPGITRHVEQCDRCAAKLEELSELPSDGDVGFNDQINVALREVYAAPDGINERVLKNIDERERADREMSLFFGLFAIAKDAAELMLPDDDPRDQRRSEREE